MFDLRQLILFVADTQGGVPMKRALSIGFKMAAESESSRLCSDCARQLFKHDHSASAFLLLCGNICSTRYMEAALQKKLRLADLMKAFWGEPIPMEVVMKLLATNGEFTWGEISDMIGEHFSEQEIPWEKEWIIYMADTLLVV
ncbi:MAG: hypothetical protein A2537_02275 [Candidatus Magasanikbacteria bacterium RIFOXYD2_FULL_36_9]|uniref:Uncharacterized protein n=1 Tax=Candidatus Magasanikbacteria bacterium RIFOXYD2_FULL_36_9 TaxID=1798707 RepID=A0A1F6P0Y2_9BACT|nr:MAG: hypothetical protein A2537_02275 [Candidatus Magasanikbacteria bacterium RIFOXYD2_FULL_36_9]